MVQVRECSHFLVVSLPSSSSAIHSVCKGRLSVRSLRCMRRIVCRSKRHAAAVMQISHRAYACELNLFEVERCHFPDRTACTLGQSWQCTVPLIVGPGQEGEGGGMRREGWLDETFCPDHLRVRARSIHRCFEEGTSLGQFYMTIFLDPNEKEFTGRDPQTHFRSLSGHCLHACAV